MIVFANMTMGLLLRKLYLCSQDQLGAVEGVVLFGVRIGELGT